MKKIVLLFMIITFTDLWLMGGAQNLIQNSTMEGVGPLADYWQVNSISTPTLTDGVQKAESPFTASIYQDVLFNAGRYKLSFDMEASNWSQVVLWIDSISGYIIGVNPIPVTTMQHYEIEFNANLSCERIEFRTVPNYATWIRVDNVTLVEVFPVGIEEPQIQRRTDQRIFDLSGRQLQSVPRGKIYIQDGKKYYNTGR